MMNERYFNNLKDIKFEANIIIKENIKEGNLSEENIKKLKDKGDKINKLIYELMDELSTL